LCIVQLFLVRNKSVKYISRVLNDFLGELLGPPAKQLKLFVLLKLARETPTTLDDDGSASINSDISDTASLSSVSSSSSTSLRLSPDSTALYDVSWLPDLSPVHTGDYSRFWRQSPFSVTVAVFGDCRRIRRL